MRDFQDLDAVTRDPNVKHITVVGGGFLGTEITAALNSRAKKAGFKVAQLFPEPGKRTYRMESFDLTCHRYYGIECTRLS